MNLFNTVPKIFVLIQDYLIGGFKISEMGPGIELITLQSYDNTSSFSSKTAELKITREKIYTRYFFGPALPFVCVEVLRPSQPNRVMSSAVCLPNHTFTGQA